MEEEVEESAPGPVKDEVEEEDVEEKEQTEKYYENET